jgi:uncharacterized integral membrane protein
MLSVSAYKRFLQKAELIIHPYFILSLLILIFNDYIGKSLMPGLLTGKLSDFSGIFIFCIFIYVILSHKIKTPRGVMILCFTIGLLFTIWKIAPVEHIFDRLERILHLPMPKRAKDISDLFALIMVALSYVFIMKRKEGVSVLFRKGTFKIALIYIIMLITGLNIIATSIVSRYTIEPDFIQNRRLDQNQLLFMLEQTMINNGFFILGRQIDDKGKLVISARSDFDYISHSG